MKGKLASAWNAIRLFCAGQVQNFYIGLTISALAFLSLFSCLPLTASALLCPFAAAMIYSILRFICGGAFEWKGENGYGNSLIAVFSASLYLLLLALL